MDPMWPVGGCAAHSPQRERLYTARSAPVMIITRSARGSVCRVRLSALARVSVCVNSFVNWCVCLLSHGRVSVVI